LIGYHPNKEVRSLKKILQDLRLLSPTVFRLVSNLTSRIKSSFIFESNRVQLSKAQPTGTNLDPGLKTVEEEPMKSFRQGMADVKKMKTQLLIKHIQGYLNQIESFSRYTV
jgi:hypothetical protein